MESARLMGIAERRNAKLPDGGIANIPEQRLGLIALIRELRPAVILAPMTPDRHPDHAAAHDLAGNANFFAGVHGVDTEQPPYRARAIYYYRAYDGPNETPSHVVDISADFERKITA